MLYPFSIHNASAVLNRTGSFESEFNARKEKKYRHRGKCPIVQNVIIPKSHLLLECNESVEDIELRSIRQRASAVTTAVISCAVGLACAENVIYIFFLGSNNTQEELRMLMFRSIFPVHGLCGAMQSIGIIGKFVEEDVASNHVGVGKIVIPSIILHGIFDSILMLANEYIEDFNDEYYGNRGDTDTESIKHVFSINIITGISIIGIMSLGVLWYLRQNTEQKLRLKTIETTIQCTLNTQTEFII